MKNQTVIILDFGGQYKELIARRIRECGVYSEIMPFDASIEKIKAKEPIGIIFTGGPNFVADKDSPGCTKEIYDLGVPVLGICYGMQLICNDFGGIVSACDKSEYGTFKAEADISSPLFNGITASQKVLMSHSDRVTKLPEGFTSIAKTKLCKYAAFENKEKKIYGVQFHPEAENTENGTAMIHNFLFGICSADGDYSMEDYLENQIKLVKEQVGNKRVLLGLSGGVDSSVCAALLSKAIPGQLVCVYVDHGCMRKGETEAVRAAFENRDLQFVYVDARKRFLDKLAGITDPEMKRKTIGKEFIRVFEDEANKVGNPEFLAQGTIYPDIVESGTNKSAVIKSHHNVGGLPKDLKFEGIVEPLKGLFKDEVRKIGRILDLPESIVNRQPFPGPGLAVRVIGDLTWEKLDILRDADYIVREEIGKSKIHADQYFAILTNMKTVGVMGDRRTYDYTVAVRAIRTTDFMTCEYVALPHKILGKISSRITNEVEGVNRVVFDITGKPPATIEWE